jgi:hypothetical protein
LEYKILLKDGNYEDIEYSGKQENQQINKNQPILTHSLLIFHSFSKDFKFLKKLITRLFTNEVQYLEAECDKYRRQSDYAIRNMDRIVRFLAVLSNIRRELPNELMRIDIFSKLNAHIENIMEILNNELIKYVEKKLSSPAQTQLNLSIFQKNEQPIVESLRLDFRQQIEITGKAIRELSPEPQIIDISKFKLLFSSYSPRINPFNRGHVSREFKEEKLKIAISILKVYSKLIVKMLKAFNLFHAKILIRGNIGKAIGEYIEFILKVKQATDFI